ncbi:hypothetical protein ERO13_A03G070500v2 [Gossypium hirsutum]|nr:hypothetical protein ERO13_A03G070500v2 [Gossypium hirsutum]
MAMQEGSPVFTPSTQVIGNAFVEQYYHILHQSPNLVHRFYQDSSHLSRPDMHGNMTTVTTLQIVGPSFFIGASLDITLSDNSFGSYMFILTHL